MVTAPATTGSSGHADVEPLVYYAGNFDEIVTGGEAGCCRSAISTEGRVAELYSANPPPVVDGMLECARACSADPTCRGFEFHEWSRGCEAHGNEGDFDHVLPVSTTTYDFTARRLVVLRCRCFQKVVLPPSTPPTTSSPATSLPTTPPTTVGQWLETDPLPAVSSWEEMAPVPTGITFESHGLGLSGRFWMFGGFTGVPAYAWMGRQTASFSPSTGVWTSHAPIPIDGGITHCAQATDGDGASDDDDSGGRGQIFLVGGMQMSQGNRWPNAFSVDTVHAYDTRDDSWSLLPPLPRARASGIAAVLRYSGSTYLHFVGEHTASRPLSVVLRTQKRCHAGMLQMLKGVVGWAACSSGAPIDAECTEAPPKGRVNLVGILVLGCFCFCFIYRCPRAPPPNRLRAHLNYQLVDGSSLTPSLSRTTPTTGRSTCARH